MTEAAVIAKILVPTYQITRASLQHETKHARKCRLFGLQPSKHDE